jgi:hypothetical protein
MKGLRLLAFAAGGGVLAIAACASFSDDGGAADAGADASGAADASERDAADAATVDSPVSIIPNGDFELGCAGWAGFYGPVTEITAVELQHAGTRACQFCSVGDAGFDEARAEQARAPHRSLSFGRAVECRYGDERARHRRCVSASVGAPHPGRSRTGQDPADVALREPRHLLHRRRRGALRREVTAAVL